MSSNYLVSANFFRTRDTFRQDMIDQSQLVRAVAFAPTGAPPTGHNLFDHMIATGVIIDPTKPKRQWSHLENVLKGDNAESFGRAIDEAYPIEPVQK